MKSAVWYYHRLIDIVWAPCGVALVLVSVLLVVAVPSEERVEVAGVIFLAVSVWWWAWDRLRRRRVATRRRQRTRELVATEEPARPTADYLLGQAEVSLMELRTELAAAERTDNPGWRRAITDFDAAALVVNDREDPVDRLGVIVLARDGLLALRNRSAEPARLCSVNPLHGPSTGPASLHLPGLQRQSLPVCHSCMRIHRWVRTMRLRVLRISDGGKPRPYYLVAGLWGEHGFDVRAMDLADRVLERLGVS